VRKEEKFQTKHEFMIVISFKCIRVYFF
jgi:hypothetical protein